MYVGGTQQRAALVDCPGKEGGTECDYSLISDNYKTKCFTCKGIIRRVKSLLEEIRTIQKNEIYAICEHCKRTGVKCKRCEYILDRYKTSKTEERKELFKQWLSKVKQLLETISHGNICQYRTCQDTSDAAELDKLMVEINSPMLAQRQLEIGTFPPMEFQENLAQSKDMLQELIQKLRDESYVRKTAAEELAESSDETACICKYLKERQIEQRKVLVPVTRPYRMHFFPAAFFSSSIISQ